MRKKIKIERFKCPKSFINNEKKLKSFPGQ